MFRLIIICLRLKVRHKVGIYLYVAIRVCSSKPAVVFLYSTCLVWYVKLIN